MAVCWCKKSEDKSKEIDKVRRRKHWDSQVEFVLTLLGYAVGLGNIWRFPYLCMRNGGGAFLIPYLVALVVIGFPSVLLELIVGQFSGLSPSKAWNVLPLFKGIGWGTIITLFIGTLSYANLLTWILYYLGMSFSAQLPWSSCNNSWNTENCFVLNADAASTMMNISSYASTIMNTSSYASSVANFTSSYTSSVANFTNGTVGTRVSPGEEFLRYNVLELSDGVEEVGGLRWQLVLCHYAGWTVICLCVIKGVQSIGKVAYLTVTAPYILLTILLVRGCLLPGSLNGILFYIRPDWSKLLEFRIWVEAALQIFYSLGVSNGGNVALASFNKFNNNCQRDAFIDVITNAMTSLYGGFAIFAIIGYMSHETGLPINEVIKSGPGLAFIAYPEALSKLPLPQLWSVLFFLMLTTLALGTEVGAVQTIVAGVIDAFPDKLRGRGHWVVLVFYIIGTTIGLIFCSRGGMYWFQLVEWYYASFASFVFIIIECFGLAWLYGLNRIYEDIEMMIGKKPSFVLKILWGGVTPTYVLVIFIYFCTGVSKPSYAGYEYPNWATGIASSFGAAGIVALIAFAIKGIVLEKGSLLKRFRSLTRPNEIWRPQDLTFRDTYNHKYGREKDIKPLNTLEAEEKV